jgi:hypothetical protein
LATEKCAGDNSDQPIDDINALNLNNHCKPYFPDENVPPKLICRQIPRRTAYLFINTTVTNLFSIQTPITKYPKIALL